MNHVTYQLSVNQQDDLLRAAANEWLVSQLTAGAVTVPRLPARAFVNVPANVRMPAPHSHDRFEETIYGLEGVTTWTIDGQRVEIAPGDAVCVPRGQIHGFENHGNVDATFLAIATLAAPGSGYFREIAQVLAATAGAAPDLAAIGAVMRRHGLTPAPPSTT